VEADLVLEGGGVRGIGLVGAVAALDTAGYRFPRVAGSSAGAVVGCLVAALQHAGEPLSRLEDVVKAIDYRRFRDSSLLGRVPLVGGLLSLLATDGLYEGAYLERFLTGALGDLGVRTFGDLRTGEASTQYGWSLVTTASDLSRRRLVRVPWDLPDYGVDPDAFSVAKAVRASAAIPFFFTPVQVGSATWVDGGLLSNFPVALFDRSDGVPPRWPTFGVRLSARAGIPAVTRPVRGPLALGLAAVETLVNDQDAAYVDNPCTVVRTVFVPASAVSPVDFGITADQSQTLYDAGLAAGRDFLATWDFPAYVRTCRS
jgi:NTE family protein